MLNSVVNLNSVPRAIATVNIFTYLDDVDLTNLASIQNGCLHKSARKCLLGAKMFITGGSITNSEIITVYLDDSVELKRLPASDYPLNTEDHTGMYGLENNQKIIVGNENSVYQYSLSKRKWQLLLNSNSNQGSSSWVAGCQLRCEYLLFRIDGVIDVLNIRLKGINNTYILWKRSKATQRHQSFDRYYI